MMQLQHSMLPSRQVFRMRQETQGLDTQTRPPVPDMSGPCLSWLLHVIVAQLLHADCV
jgi:hypothetical protein